jgi:RNA polymerase sigma-70 factor (ECF subfamily)
MHADARARLQHALAALAGGERGAFDDVFALSWPVLRALATRLLGDDAEAEDAAQRALMKLFSRASCFDPERDALPWVATFAINEVRTVRARRRRRATTPLRLDQDDVPTVEGPETQLMRAELCAALLDIVGTLTRADRVALGLESAVECAIAGATARKRKQRALARLRTAWRRIHGLA